MSEPEGKAPDYGEPWQIREGGGAGREDLINDRHGNWISEGYGGDKSKCHARTLSCVNALAGCPDPEAFVKKVREAKEEFDGGLRDTILDDPALSWLREKSK